MVAKNLYENRKFVVGGIIVLLGVIFLWRLFSLQVLDEDYKQKARDNTMRKMTVHPARGLIYDRNGELIVYNEATYDLMVVCKQAKGIDTLAMCELLGIDLETYRKKIYRAKVRYGWYRPAYFETQIPKEQASYFREKLHKFQGFYLQARTMRHYPEPIAAHVLGYIGEVNQRVLDKDPYYKMRDFIGISGLESYYEEDLRGQKGVKIVMVDNYGRVKGHFANGKYDTNAVAGKDLYCTLDAALQAYGEQLMQNKRGSIVAIEPSTGEILSLVTAPSYDPNLLVGRQMPSNYDTLLHDKEKPLFNRALSAKYPPGSIFKIVQALIALEDGLININTGFPCTKSLVGCHNHPATTNVKKAIQFSCNPYFYYTFKRMVQRGEERSIFKDSRIGLAKWKKSVLKFGLGSRMGLDLYGLKAGYIPGVDFYDRWYGKNRWAFSTIYSLSIGQGEVEVVPLQMANLAAIFANRGYYIEPHLVRKVGEDGEIPEQYREKKWAGVDRKHYDPIVEAMYAVVHEAGGTARLARWDSVAICGKTGTAQNPHGEDHSVFIAFAPMHNPKIAIAVYVENAGFGGTWAGPIASLMIEKYLAGEVKREAKEKRILDAIILD